MASPGGFPSAGMTANPSGKQQQSKKALKFDVEAVPRSAVTSPAEIVARAGENPLAGGDRRPLRSLGALAGNLPESERRKKTRYVTTPIYYSNSSLHVGHAYCTIVADAQARFYRLDGFDTRLLTGVDEHGQKVQERARERGVPEQAHCDELQVQFVQLFERLGISYDRFMRTTAPDHKETAREVWRRCAARGDIYFSDFESWYMVREERFVTDREAEALNYMDNGKPLERRREAVFFFRLGKYLGQVKQKIEEDPDWLRPEPIRREILKRIEEYSDARDLCISRPKEKLSWGVDCPETAPDGAEHVFYVWFDALANYLSGVDGLGLRGTDLCRYWPATAHVIGKDIAWFHTAILGAMLLSAELPLPGSVLVHGMLAGPDGRKMSKSFGNVVDPVALLDEVPPDSLRWYFLSDFEFGADGRFIGEALRNMHNADLCNNLGNVVNRAVKLAGGAVPPLGLAQADAGGEGQVAGGGCWGSPPFDVEEVVQKYRESMSRCELSVGAGIVRRACSELNAWVARLEPWKLKKAEPERAAAVVRVLLEAVYVLAHLFAPFIPTAAEAILGKLGAPLRPLSGLRGLGRNLATGQPVSCESVLFRLLEEKA